MNSDLDVDERRAAALPEDWPEDFAGPTCLNACTDCPRVFTGKVSRTQCHVCAQAHNGEPR